ncbi:transposase [Hydrogenimonas thermophila]|uniref:REP-associated tyrosine transposase n=1 Tax=Hydrogenimonas thermophila TaxID=223786 RepID=UPI002936EFC0|nr:transposase [Hydrogenimonas thermophila]WOE69027.1 transposase [Hydrogenimonas thermophila]WOE71537.1 transposase [Hydrogenimonas thermophila]
MPRKSRIEKNGFYHIINRGVAREAVFLVDDDFKKFLEILQEASEEYGFEIFSFVLMSNHYHLLMKINNENLSQIMQKINSRYSIYFNKKYKRVGPLWQGRFKSWYVYDDLYLATLARYIEFNPIKANITKNIGEYKWSMSSNSVKFSMLNFKLIEKIDFTKEFDEKELEKLDEFMKAKVEIKNGEFQLKEKLPLESYFLKESDKHKKSDTREVAIAKAIKDGFTQKEIALYLNLSSVAISKIYKTYRQKVKLFNKLRDKGIFWSYSKDLSFDNAGESLTIEYLLKYGDFDDIVLGFKLFGKRAMKRVWQKSMVDDKRFVKLNLMLARVFFGMDVESDYFKRVKNARLEKFRLLAS